ncbi:hypothetical protein [Ruminococcus flavefaciens]|uniref:hypothetical protein n=1 Tax=Ruminococcus flavefaciens TaxID=1265 RepID=UPI0026F0131F|nr:hypothetical protein [Ruminococcus flavefaciens]
MTETENFGLKKPDENDLYSEFVPKIFADNMDKIDAALDEISKKSGGSKTYGIGIIIAPGTAAAPCGVITQEE